MYVPERNQNRIAIVGSQCSGKTTVANVLREFLLHEWSRPSIPIKFADPIYAAQELVTDKKNRLFMQGFGQLARDCFGEDVFNRIFKEKLKKENTLIDIVCDDARRISELEFLEKEDFYIIHVTADKETREKRAGEQGLIFKEDDVSESDIPYVVKNPWTDEYHVNYIVDNNGKSLEELQEEVCYFMYVLPMHQSCLIDEGYAPGKQYAESNQR